MAEANGSLPEHRRRRNERLSGISLRHFRPSVLASRSSPGQVFVVCKHEVYMRRWFGYFKHAHFRCRKHRNFCHMRHPEKGRRTSCSKMRLKRRPHRRTLIDLFGPRCRLRICVLLARSASAPSSPRTFGWREAGLSPRTDGERPHAKHASFRLPAYGTVFMPSVPRKWLRRSGLGRVPKKLSFRESCEGSARGVVHARGNRSPQQAFPTRARGGSPALMQAVSQSGWKPSLAWPHQQPQRVPAQHK